jgi:voltage-gated potassium channel
MADGSPWWRLAVAGAAFVALLAFGVVGYMLIEGWSFIDALYMTVTTVTTVGFREIEPLRKGDRYSRFSWCCSAWAWRCTC